jgi:DNA-binding CsgD family transcriptional regulator
MVPVRPGGRPTESAVVNQGGETMTIAAMPGSADDRWRQRTPLTLHLDHLAIEGLMSALGRRSDGAGPRALPDELRRLTDRELTVLRAMATGATNAEIAAELFLSVATVKTHVARVLSKLGLRDRVQAVVFAYESRLVIPS